LREHHPNITLVEAGDLLIANGGIIGALRLINKAFAIAFPEVKENAGTEQGESAGMKGERPMMESGPDMLNGTGRNSSAIGSSAALTPTVSGGEPRAR
jgi:hypothetical protein